VLGATLVGSSTDPVLAQGGSDIREKLEEDLQRTDEMLREAVDVVEASESERARRLLRNAKIIQDSAWDWFGHCGLTSLRACRNSSEATTRSRREIRHAIQVARQQSGQERAAQQAIDRAQRMLDDANSSIRGEATDNERSLHLLNQAQAQLERAREQFRGRHFAVALQLAQASARLVQQALHLGDVHLFNPDRVRRELERTDRLMERAGPVIRESGNQRAMQLFERAVQLQTRARESHLEQRLVVALRLTREARLQVQKALRLIGGGPVDLAAVERALEQTDNLIERAEPVIREAGQERALELFGKGLERQAKAKQHLADGQLRPALAQTRVARRLIQEALDMIDQDGALGL
jgi:hypothetical protein